jgi:hypothetical protein
VGSTAIPAFAVEADYQVVGTLGDVLALKRDTVRRLFRQVDVAHLRALVRAEPDSGFELLLGDEIVSLWYAGKRLAVVSVKGKQS